MSSTSRLKQAVDRHRRQLRDAEREAVSALDAAFRHACAVIGRTLDRFYIWVAEKLKRGEAESSTWLAEDRWTTTLTSVVTEQMTHFGIFVQTTTLHLQQTGMAFGVEAARTLLASVLPSGFPRLFGVPSPAALFARIGATRRGSPLAQLFSGFGAEAAKNVIGALMRGLLAGHGVRGLKDDVAQALEQTRQRALTITENELNRSARQASEEVYRENEDLCEGWTWVAELDPDTCAACIALHGTFHLLSERMESHIRCRCVAVPAVRPWSDLLASHGIDAESLSEHPPTVQSGASWFAEQDEATQRAILGKSGYDLYAAGKVSLQDFVGRSHDPDWGHSIYQKPVKALVKGRT